MAPTAPLAQVGPEALVAPEAGVGPDAPAAPAQPTQTTLSATGTLVNGDGMCGANWQIQRCGGGPNVPVRSDMAIDGFRSALVRVQGLPQQCAPSGKDVIWLSSIEAVSDCAPPTPTPPPSPTPQPGPNLALGQPVVATSGDPTTPPEWAVDGDPATAWRVPGLAAWIWVDLGQERTFNRMRLTWGQPHAVRYGIFVQEYRAWEFKYEVDGSDGGVDELVIPRLYGRYVLLYMVESGSAGGGFSLQEWEIFGQETATLAYGQRVDVSDEQDCCPGYLANDARYDTGWASRVRAREEPGQPTPEPEDRNPWLRLRLPTGSRVVELRIFWDNLAFPWNYRIVLYDGATFPRVLQAKSLRGGQHLISYPFPVTTDAILLYTDILPPVNFVALTELEAYGPAELFLFNSLPGLGRKAPERDPGVTWRWLPRQPGLRPPTD
jgi:hypothetical protein